MHHYCNICSKNVLAHAYQLLCSICKTHVHLNCLPNVGHDDPLFVNRENNDWICTICMISILPFTNVYDDDEFLCTLQANQLHHLNMTITELNNNTFILEEPEEMDHNDVLADYDPDVNFYNPANNMYIPSKYYSIDSFTEAYCRQGFSSELSLFHTNIRSLPSNAHLDT